MSVEVASRPSRTPEPTEPDLALYAFTAALSGGDPGTAAACFTREGCLVTADGTAVHGREQIAGLLAQLIARRTEIEVEQLIVRRAGEVALVDGRWTMHSDGPEGTRFSQPAAPTLVLRLVEETWKIAVIAPWGGR